MTEQFLKLDPATMRYRGGYTIEFDVEAEIVFRAIVRYAEENNLDATNLTDWGMAIQAVARSSKWIDHPRAKWLEYSHMKPAASEQAAPVSPVPAPVEPKPARVIPRFDKALKRPGPAPAPTGKRIKYHVMTVDDIKALREKALDMPVDQWDSLKTRIVKDDQPGLSKARRDSYYRRSDENKVLEALKKELEPAKPETLEAVAGALNGNRLK